MNCSVLPIDTCVIWKYGNSSLIARDGDKYTQNSTGLIIHNVTNDDEGQYLCLVDQVKKAFILLDVICKVHNYFA